MLHFISNPFLILYLAVTSQFAHAALFNDKAFTGRIAYSADGNHNDEDDWAASPVALAIIAECGAKDRLVHFDYNCILSQTNPEWERTHGESVLGAADHYGYNRSLFYNCRQDLQGAMASIAKAINASSAENRLYFIVAGPMEVPFLGVQKSDPDKRQYVYCISHSRWNDGFAHNYTFTQTKRSVIESGVHWVQIRDQNGFLSTSPYGRPARPEEWRLWHWMRDSEDAKVRFLWQRLLVSTRADCSDAGMAYFLMTGDEGANVAKLKAMLTDHVIPLPQNPRKQVRIEAENFTNLEGFQLEDRSDRQASHRLNIKLTGREGRIRIRFDEPYTVHTGRYQVDIRFQDEKERRCQFALFVNGVRQGSAWNTLGKGQNWTTQTIPDVPVRIGDEIQVEVKGDTGALGRLDYVELYNKEAFP